MPRPRIIALRLAQLLLAALLCAWAAQALRWHATLPRTSSARYCGNCLFASIGIPLEAAAAGLLMLWLTLAKPAPHERAARRWAWGFLLIGIFLTPMICGVPVYLCGAGALSWSAARSTLRHFVST